MLAWRDVIGNLIEYFEQLESYQKTKSKECQKLSRALEVPFKTPEFATDGIATIWQAMRDKAIQMSNFHIEEANLIKAGPIAELTRLRGDLKNHLYDLDKEGLQGSKRVGKWMDKFVSPSVRKVLTFFSRVITLKVWGNGFLLRRRILRV